MFGNESFTFELIAFLNWIVSILKYMKTVHKRLRYKCDSFCFTFTFFIIRNISMMSYSHPVLIKCIIFQWCYFEHFFFVVKNLAFWNLRCLYRYSSIWNHVSIGFPRASFSEMESCIVIIRDVIKTNQEIFEKVVCTEWLAALLELGVCMWHSHVDTRTHTMIA